MRRHFLIAAYEAAGLKRRARELKRLFGAELTRSATAGGGLSRRSFRLTWAELLLILAIAFAFLAGVGDLGKGGHWLSGWEHKLAGAGLLAAFVTILGGLLRDKFRVTARVNPFGSVEEFEDQLTRLITHDARAKDQRPVDRFVFFIDDLDRCRDQMVVEAIETLQAFFGRDRCVYIVAADRDQLRRAVRRISVGPASTAAHEAAIPSDESFLEKIFQVAVEVPPPLSSTLTEYAQALLRETSQHGSGARVSLPELDESDIETVVDYLLHADVDSPRQVRVILNEFTMALGIAGEREAAPDAHLAHHPLTASKALLAKFVVLRVHYPWFYALLVREPELLIRAQDRVEAIAMRSQAAESDEVAWERVRQAAARSAGQQIAFEAENTGEEDAGQDAEEGEAKRRRHRDSAEVDDLVNRRVSSLEGFLFQTLETPVSDTAQIEEFIYVRGRQEFENLPGAEGAEYRRALMQGDTRRLDELAQSAPDLLVPALEAGIARLASARAIERPRVRRAVLALAAHAPAATLTNLGRPTLDALYPDEFTLDEDVERDDLAGLCQLIPHMNANELRALIAAHALREPDDLVRFAAQARRTGSAELWSKALAPLSEDQATLEALRERTGDLDRDDAAGLLQPTLQSLRPIIEAPSAWLAEPLTVQSWDPDEQELSVVGADGAAIEIAVPEELNSLAEAYAVNASVQIEAVQTREGTWRAVALSDPDGTLTTVEAPPLRISDDVRRRAFALIDRLAEQASAGAEAVKSLLTWDYPDGDVWARALDSLVTALARHPSESGSFAAETVRACDRIDDALPKMEEGPARELASAALRLIAGSCQIPRDQLRPHAAGLLSKAIHLAPQADDAARSALSLGLHPASRAFGASLVYETAKRELPPGWATRRQLIQTIVEPLDAGRALMLALDDLNDAVQRRSSSEDENERNSLLTTIRNYMHLTATIAPKTARARKQLARLPVIADQTYATQAICLVDRLEADFDPPTEMLSRAASANAAGLAATSNILLRADRTTDPDLDAVLEGIGRAALRRESLPPEVENYQRAVQTRVPRLEQHGRIAELVSWTAAERVGGEGILDDLLGSAAKLIRTTPDQARVRLSLASAWASSSQARRRTAAEGYCRLLGRAHTEDQLTAVIEGLHQFFNGRVPPDVGSLRDAVYKALTRVFGKRSPSAETMETLRDQLDGIHLLGTSSKPAPARIRKLLGV